MTETTNALDVQVGGGHYKGFAIEPGEFAMANLYDICASSILRYVSRHRLKGGVEDIRKAIHYVAYREQLAPCASHLERLVVWLRGETRLAIWRRQHGWTITMEHYIAVNQLQVDDALALLALEAWLESGEKGDRECLLHHLHHLESQYA